MSQKLTGTDKSKEDIQLTSEYLLAEFDKLHQRAALQEQVAANKTNFFLVSVTGVTGGIVIFSDNQFLQPTFFPVAILAIAIMFVLGLSTLLQVMDLVSNSAFYYRRIGRIRRWFLDHDPSLIKYMPFVVADDRPGFLPDRGFLKGAESILVILNASLFASFFVLLSFYIIGLLSLSQPSFIPIIPLIGLLVFGLTLYIQVAYYKRYLLALENYEISRNKVHFPRKDARDYNKSELEKVENDDNKRNSPPNKA